MTSFIWIEMQWSSEDKMTEAVIRDVKDGLVTLTLNRPEKLNALNFDIFKALSAHVDFARENVKSVGCVVLRGAGRSFCAGNDLSDLGGVFEGGDGSHFRSTTV